MQEKQEDIYLRDDMVEFATDISHSNFNVKHFKKLHAAKHIKVASQKTRTRIYTQHRDSVGLEEQSSLHSKTVGQGLNRTLRYNESNVSMRREAKMFSKPMVKSADRLEHIKSRKKLSGQEKMVSNLEKYEKEWSKGKIKERCIEEWLNSILVEYCHDEYFDKNIANSALKKLGIDENSLVAKGLPPQNVTRLYRGLFVFGMGFNSLIGELANGNMEVLKTIWRIYSIILEYCSKGGMVTVIGEIERETSAKVAALTSEIVRRQEIIERNEELNEEKNGEIFREIKKLREDNNNLNNEKTVLVEEYNATEQAFSEEVGLRLKFQTKINEIYGLHRELGIKHQKLFQEFSTKVEELRICADKYFQATIKSQQFRETQYRLREELVLLKMSARKDKEYLQELLKERVALITMNSKLEFTAIEAQNEIAELKNREKLWLSDKVNLQSMIEFREKSSKETHSEYQITLQENNRLYILLSDQRKVMEQYQKQKKNFNSKVISIVSENSYHKRKMEQIQRKYDGLQESYKQLQVRMEQLNLQIEIKTKSEESYQSFFSNNEQNLIQLRRINNSNEEELTFLRKYYKDMEKILKTKNEGYEALIVKYQTAFDQLEAAKAELQELHSKFALLSEQKRINEEVFGMKEAKIKVMQAELVEKEEQLDKMKLKFLNEEEKMRLQLDKIAVSYKNEKFERSTLNSSYNQALKIIEQKNKTERELSVKISLLEGDIEKEKSRYRVLEKNMMNTIQAFGRMQEQLEDTLNEQRRIIVARQEFVHPMFLHDLTAEIEREMDRSSQLKAKIRNIYLDMEKERKVNQAETEKLHNGYKYQIALITKQSQKRIENLTSEISFEKQENSNLKTTVKYYQELADSYRKKISERETSQRQEIYKYTIEQKKKEMEKMFVEMERLQDELQHAKKMNAMRGENLTASEIQSNNESSERLKLIDSLRRELEHEFQLKLKELQRQMKREYSKKETELRQQQQSFVKNLSLQQILKIKEMKPNELMKELSVTQKSNQLKEMSSKNSFQASHEALMRGEVVRAQDSKKRRQISRIIKNAYEYYN